MKKQKPIKEWLNELPEPIRSRAIKNYLDVYPNYMSPKCISQQEAVGGAFMWDQTPEGDKFWNAVSMGETPELPDHIKDEE